jgi:hypothetical protein
MESLASGVVVFDLYEFIVFLFLYKESHKSDENGSSINELDG